MTVSICYYIKPLYLDYTFILLIVYEIAFLKKLWIYIYRMENPRYWEKKLSLMMALIECCSNA
jgi:hypothetical protein